MRRYGRAVDTVCDGYRYKEKETETYKKTREREQDGDTRQRPRRKSETARSDDPSPKPSGPVNAARFVLTIQLSTFHKIDARGRAGGAVAA